jgi:hypothetical protein
MPEVRFRIVTQFEFWISLIGCIILKGAHFSRLRDLIAALVNLRIVLLYFRTILTG